MRALLCCSCVAPIYAYHDIVVFCVSFYPLFGLMLWGRGGGQAAEGAPHARARRGSLMDSGLQIQVKSAMETGLTSFAEGYENDSESDPEVETVAQVEMAFEEALEQEKSKINDSSEDELSEALQGKHYHYDQTRQLVVVHRRLLALTESTSLRHFIPLVRNWPSLLTFLPPLSKLVLPNVSNHCSYTHHIYRSTQGRCL